MKRIDNKTVDLTNREVMVQRTFDEHMRDGHTIPAAARMALNHHNYRDREFVAYLSDGTCEVKCGRVRVKPEFRTTLGSPLPTADEMRQRLGLVTS